MTAPSPFARFLAAGEDEVSAIETRTRAGTGAAAPIALDAPSQSARTPYLPLLLVGLGGLFAGVTGPLLSTFVPPLVRDALGEHRTAIGAVMADRQRAAAPARAVGRRGVRPRQRPRPGPPADRALRVRAGGGGMALFPVVARCSASPACSSAIVVLYTGINIQRSPVQALIADLVPSRYRSLATGSVTFQMCVGAIVFLMLGRMLGMRPAFLIAAGTVLAIAAAFALGLREPAVSESHAAEADVPSRSSTPRGRPCAVWCRACAPSSSRRSCCS